jgi:hypothetical protein
MLGPRVLELRVDDGERALVAPLMLDLPGEVQLTGVEI